MPSDTYGSGAIDGSGTLASDGLGKQVVAVTPGRGSLLRLDVPTLVNVEPASSWSFAANEMSLSQEAQAGSHDVELLDRDGWQLRPLQRKARGYQRERTETASSVVPFTTPAGIFQVSTFRKPSDQPGGLTGASANISTSGDPVIKKKVGAGQNWDDATLFQLATDYAAFPPPDSTDDTIVMDRIAVSIGNHNPEDAFFNTFSLSGSKKDAGDKASVTYFSGPSGVDRNFVGYGWYCLEEYGDGILKLFERGNVTGSSTLSWCYRGQTRYCTASMATTGTHVIYVRPVPYDKPRGSANGRIYIYGEAQEGGQVASQRGSMAAGGTLSLLWVYTAPNRGKNAPAAHSPVPIRLDTRRTARHEKQIQMACYPNTGTLRGDIFTADSWLLSSEPLRMYWFYPKEIPSGCSVGLAVYDALTDVALTPTATHGSITDSSGRVIGGYQYFTIIYPQRQFYPVFTFTGNGDLNGGTHSSKTPILWRWTGFKDGRADDLSPTEVTSKVMDISGTSQDKDPTHETAACTIKDLGNSIDILSYRATIPYILQTKVPDVYSGHFDADHLVSVYGTGWLQKAVGTRRGSKMPQGLGGSIFPEFPASDWKAYALNFLGEWVRPSTQRMPFRWDFARPSDQGMPAIAANVIKDGLTFCGYTDDQIDTPGLHGRAASPVRLYNYDQTEDHLDTLTDIWPFLLYVAFDYMGHWMCFDRNAKIPGSAYDRGIWRVLPQNTMNGPVLAHFHTQAATDANKLHAMTPPHAQGAYPVETISGQQCQHSYVVKRTLDGYTRSPEANLVSLTTHGDKLFSNSGRDSAEAISITLANSKSYNFAGLDPSDPNYPPTANNPDYLPFIVPLLFPDPFIHSVEGAEWVLAHIYERVAHGGKIVYFMAPMLYVWDHTDAYQIRPRPLRFYDLIMIDGIKFYIRNIAFKWRKDRAQWAIYQCELPNGTLY